MTRFSSSAEFTKRKAKTILPILAALIACGGGVIVAQDSNAPAPAASVAKATPTDKNVAAGETEAKRLLLLMDRDQSGKVSRQEFMDFMAAEFDRLDKNKDGELDVRELTQTRLTAPPRGAIHR
jgi:type IV secretory pathway VirJ component